MTTHLDELLLRLILVCRMTVWMPFQSLRKLSARPRTGRDRWTDEFLVRRSDFFLSGKIGGEL